MAHIVYTPTKNNQNEKGNYCWGYKDFDAIQNVLSYVLLPDLPVIYSMALGIPQTDIEHMALFIDNSQRLFRQDTGRRIRHEILTFDHSLEFIRPDGQNMLLTIAYACALFYYSIGFPTVYSVWTYDKERIRNLPEIHFVVSTVSMIDGHKYHINHEGKELLNRYFNNLARYYTSNLFKKPMPPFGEPDYSDCIFLPDIS